MLNSHKYLSVKINLHSAITSHLYVENMISKLYKITFCAQSSAHIDHSTADAGLGQSIATWLLNHPLNNIH